MRARPWYALLIFIRLSAAGQQLPGIVSPNAVFCSESIQTFSLSGLTSATAYTWEVTPAGYATIVSDPHAPQLACSFPTGGVYTIKLRYKDSLPTESAIKRNVQVSTRAHAKFSAS